VAEWGPALTRWQVELSRLSEHEQTLAQLSAQQQQQQQQLARHQQALAQREEADLPLQQAEASASQQRQQAEQALTSLEAEIGSAALRTALAQHQQQRGPRQQLTLLAAQWRSLQPLRTQRQQKLAQLNLPIDTVIKRLKDHSGSGKAVVRDADDGVFHDPGIFH